MASHILGNGSAAHLVTFLVIGVNLLESIKLVAKDFLGSRKELRAVANSIERSDLETFALLTDVHQTRMTAARNGQQRVASDVVVVHPEVTPHLDVVGIALVNANHSIVRDAHLPRAVLLALVVGKVTLNGLEISVHLLFW